MEKRYPDISVNRIHDKGEIHFNSYSKKWRLWRKTFKICSPF